MIPYITSALFPLLELLSAPSLQSVPDSDSNAPASSDSGYRSANHSAIFDGLKVLFAGMFFEFSRRAVQVVYETVSARITISAQVRDDDEAYDWLHHYLAKHCALAPLNPSEIKARYSVYSVILDSIYPKGRSASREIVITSSRYGRKGWATEDVFGDDESCGCASDDEEVDAGRGEGEVQVRLDLTPKPGVMQSIRFQGKTITMGVQEIDSRYESNRLMTLSASFATHQLFEALIHHARQEYIVRDIGKISIFAPDDRHGCGWRRSSTKPARPWESVIFPAQVKEYVLADAKEFVAEKDFYSARGLPYRRGYLLYGVPGSGKSTLSQCIFSTNVWLLLISIVTVGAIAAKLKLDVFALSIGSRSLDDCRLSSLLSSCPPHCIVLIEDIDCAFKHNGDEPDDEDAADDDKSLSHAKDGPSTASKKTKSNRTAVSDVTLSGLLNALDGVASTEGRLLFCTTNHVDQIDPALSRPGRCDVWVEFTYATAEQIKDVYLQFYSVAGDESRQKPSVADPASPPMTHDGCEKVVMMDAAARPPTPPPTPKPDLTALPSSSPKDNIDRLADEFASIVPSGKLTVSALQGYLMRYKRQPNSAVIDAKSWVEGGFKQSPTATLVAGGRVSKKEFADCNEK